MRKWSSVIFVPNNDKQWGLPNHIWKRNSSFVSSSTLLKLCCKENVNKNDNHDIGKQQSNLIFLWFPSFTSVWGREGVLKSKSFFYPLNIGRLDFQK